MIPRQPKAHPGGHLASQGAPPRADPSQGKFCCPLEGAAPAGQPPPTPLAAPSAKASGGRRKGQTDRLKTTSKEERRRPPEASGQARKQRGPGFTARKMRPPTVLQDNDSLSPRRNDAQTTCSTRTRHRSARRLLPRKGHPRHKRGNVFAAMRQSKRHTTKIRLGGAARSTGNDTPQTCQPTESTRGSPER